MDELRRQQRLSRFTTLLRNPDAPIGAVDEAYLELEGEQLWIDAIERAQSDGRGAMMVDLRNPASGEVDVFYLPHALVLADLPPGDGALAQALQSYDPVQEAIIVIWHRHGSTFYRVGARD